MPLPLEYTNYWMLIDELEVLTDGAIRTVVTAGDSITDGSGSVQPLPLAYNLMPA